MAWVIDNSHRGATVQCDHCNRTIGFHKSDMQHYRHDVEGNNVYLECPGVGCGRCIPVYKQAVQMGWVEADPY